MAMIGDTTATRNYKIKSCNRANRHENKDWFSIIKDDPKNYFLKHLQSQSNIPAFPIH